MNTNTAKNSNIEAILPLSEMQEGILIHHLQSKWDEGFLHVEFGIDGELIRDDFVTAWKHTIARHDILRTTVHWEKIEKPLQVIHGEKEAVWEFYDWRSYGEAEQKEKITSLKQTNREAGTNFSKNPLNNYHLITLAEKKHYFLWPCHHLLLDGWSGSNIIKDVLALYDALTKKEAISLEPLPSLKAYYSWLNKKDPQATKKFWASYLEGFNSKNLLEARIAPQEDNSKVIDKVVLSTRQTEVLNSIAKRNKITLNTLIQGAWTLLLGAYFRNDDILFGTTIAGRSNDFPNMEKLAGVFTNILPVRSTINPSLPLNEWLHNFQSRQLSCLNYGHINQNEISSLLNKTMGTVLFDNLLIFENYPSKKIKSGAIEVAGFKSGITSNYPLSLVVLPHKEITFRFIYQQNRINTDIRNWISANWKVVLDLLIIHEASTLKDILERIPAPEFEVTDNVQTQGVVSDKGKVAPRNKVETKLLSIWQKLLGHKNIGVEDNFFEIGGKSLMAIKMVSTIASDFDVKLPITALLFHPTIALLAKEIGGDRDEDDSKGWEFLVPLRTEGNSSPVFCIHGGEGHILFYKQMSTYLNEDRPIYLVQPKGIHGDGPMHESIEQMSEDYISEMLRVPGIESFNLVFYCYSAIAIEMSSRLQQMGKRVNLIIIDSWAPAVIRTARPGIGKRLKIYFKSFSSNPVLAVKASLTYRYQKHLEAFYLKLINDKIKLQLRHIRYHLRGLYYRYKWKKIGAPCLLIIADKEHQELKLRKAASWKNWITSKVEVAYCPGNHFSMFEDPNAEALAGLIEDACATKG